MKRPVPAQVWTCLRNLHHTAAVNTVTVDKGKTCPVCGSPEHWRGR